MKSLPRLVLFVVSVFFVASPLAAPPPPTELSPLLKTGAPVSWWFVFKFNAASFPGCTGSSSRSCIFGGTVQGYPSFSQQFIYSSSSAHAPKKPTSGCLGDATADPVGATFKQIYNGSTNYVLWNDQFYDDPIASQNSPWGHSKGVLAWDNDGNGFVLQVSTPSWPGSGNSAHPRTTDGNTLGCVTDNDVKVSQHFFALRLTKDDVIAVLNGLQNASVVTDVTKNQIVKNGGPADIQAMVKTLGKESTSAAATKVMLSTGVTLISKPSALHVPPWQMVSALMGGIGLRVATWWTTPKIPSTTSSTAIGCWDNSLGAAGAITNAEMGHWKQSDFGLTGGPGTNNNHAKIGVSTSADRWYSIFGDLNQQGSLSGNCASSQNGRGGLFYVVEDETLARGVRSLIQPKSGQ